MTTSRAAYDAGGPVGLRRVALVSETAEAPVPPQPTLRDGDVVLRPWTLEDAEPARVQHDEEMARWFGWPGIVSSLERQQSAIEEWHRRYRNDRSVVAFLVEHHGEVAGAVEVRQRKPGVGELSWAVFPRHRRQRVATRAVRLLVHYCFAELGLSRVDAEVEPDNLASLRTAGRAGLRREGVARRSGVVGEQLVDLVWLARLADDPPPDTLAGRRGVLDAGLPRKRLIAQGVLRDADGRILLCELTYKREWDLPGGIVEPREPPSATLVREIREELGIDVTPHGLLLVEWLPPWQGWDDASLLVFDLGRADADLVETMVLEEREIAGVHWCRPDEAAAHAASYLTRILEALDALGDGETAYLEGGRPLG